MEPKPTSPGAVDAAKPAGTPTNEPQTVVIALDASQEAEHSVNWYLGRIHRQGNRLVFVHCIELPEMKLNEASKFKNTHTWSMHMSPGVLATMWKEEEAKTKELEGKMRKLMKEKGLSGVLRTSTGKPGEVICRIAEEEQAAMIVTGTRGLGKVRRTILGSVADYLVHHAHCPVIICRHPEEVEKQRQRRMSGEGRRSRHTSGESILARLRHPSGDKKKLKESAEKGKLRQLSTDSTEKKRNPSGSDMKGRSMSVGSEPE